VHPACRPALRRISEQTLASSRRVKDLVSASCVRSLGRTQHYHGRGQKLSRPLWHSWPSTGVAVSSTGAWTAAMCGCRARAAGSSCTRTVSRPAGHPRLPPRMRRAAMATHSKRGTGFSVSAASPVRSAPGRYSVRVRVRQGRPPTVSLLLPGDWNRHDGKPDRDA
jgi:hypothetical protein